MKPKLKLIPNKDVLPAGTPGTFDVMVSLTAPRADTKVKRSPLNLALAIDCSGSMSGQPINEAKECARRIVEGLHDDDIVAVISFNQAITVHVEATKASNRKEIIRQIARISANGMTNVHGGWLEGANQISPHLADNRISRVIVLSDGNTNQGLQDTAQIVKQCAELADTGITTSTYGLGHSFNEDLMFTMAKAGLGNAYYGETANDLAPEFEAELGILDQTCGKHLRMKVSSNAGDVDILNDYRKDADGTVNLPNMVHGAEVWAICRITIDKLGKGKSDDFLQVEIAWQDLQGKTQPTLSAGLDLEAVGPKAFAKAEENKVVTERVKEVIAAIKQAEVKQALRDNDWDNAKSIIASIKSMAGSNAYIDGVASSLQSLADAGDAVMLSKEATFASSNMSRRYAAENEDIATIASTSSITRRKLWQGRKNG